MVDIKKSIADLQKEYTEHIENIENVLFAHNSLQMANKQVTFKWVMKEYLHMFRIGKAVHSPIFYTKVCGYSFQLYVQWSGPNKGKLGLFAQLHRGKTPHRFLGDFNYECTLAFHGEDGKVECLKVTQDEIERGRNKGFCIKSGKDSA